MRHSARFAIGVALLFGAVFGSSTIGYAQVSGVEEGDSDALTIRFDRLTHFGNQVLHSPYDTTRFSFGLPPSWKLIEGAELQLDVIASRNHDLALGGILEIHFNGVALDAVAVDWVGERTITVPIPAEALIPFRSDGRHEFRATLDTDFTCDSNLQSTLIIQSRSRLMLPHDLVPPSLDLRSLPRPIYHSSFLPDTAILVVPDQPSQDELQAAITVAAGFGKMTGGELGLQLIPQGQMTTSLEQANHLIFVGKPAAFPALADIAFPARIGAGGFRNLESDPTDGVLLFAASPWNPNKAVLLVSGLTDEGVIKAGQAVSSGQIVTGAQPNIALVAEVRRDDPAAVAPPLDATFAELGYATETFNDVGLQSVSYRFFVPPGQQMGQEAYLDLVLSHSPLLDHDLSSLTIELNGQPAGGVSFGPETSNLGRTRIQLPANSGQSGSNELAINAELRPASSCFDARSGSLWLTIQSESSMHLPLEAFQADSGPVANLSEYPHPFALDPSLSSTAFVLPADDPAAWDVAARIARDFGDRSRGVILEPTVIYGEAAPQDLVAANHLVTVGRLENFKFLDDLDQAISAQFPASGGIADEQNLRVVFRLPDPSSVGYLELLPSPWNPAYSVLAVVSKTDEGIQFAGSALTNSAVRRTMAGNFAVVSGDQVAVADALFSIKTLAGEPSGQSISILQQTATSGSSRGTLVLAIFTSLLLVVGLSVGATLYLVRRTQAVNRSDSTPTQ